MIKFPKNMPPEILEAYFDALKDMPVPTRKDAVIYVRKSRIEKDTLHRSPKIQEKECRELAEREGMNVIDVVVDLDETGKNSDRDGLQKVLRMVKKGVVDYVLIQYLDRNYRNGFGSLHWINTLQTYNVQLLSVHEEIDTRTLQGRFLFMVNVFMAENTVHKTSEKGRQAAKDRREEGLHRGGYRLGYCNGLCSDCTDPNGKDYCPLYGGAVRPESKIGRIQVPHPVEKHAVRLIVYSYQQGMSGSEIASYLNYNTFQLPEFGERVFQFRTKGVKGWKAPGRFSAEGVMDIIKNIFYTGYVAHYHTPDLSMRDDLENPKSVRQTRKRRHIPEEIDDGQHEALYPHSVWVQNQALIKSKRTSPTSAKRRVRTYTLRGIAQCWDCLPYTPSDRTPTLRGTTNGSKQKIYICANMVGKKAKTAKNALDLDAAHNAEEVDLKALHSKSKLLAEDLEKKVNKLVTRLVIPPEWYEQILAYTLHTDGMSRFQRERYNLQAAFQKQVKLFELGAIDETKLRNEQLRISNALAKLAPENAPDAPEYTALLADFGALWQRMTPTEQHGLLQIIFAQVYFDSYGTLKEAHAYAPFAQLLGI